MSYYALAFILNEFKMEQLDDIVLLKIFSNLPFKSIEFCGDVCTRWSRLANEVKLKRKNQVQAILYASRNEAESRLKSELDSMSTEPVMAIVFLTENCAERKQRAGESSQSSESPSPNKRRRFSAPRVNCSRLLRDNLKEASKLIYVYTSGVLGTNYENTTVTEREKSSEIGIGGMIFSKNDHLRVSLIKIGHEAQMPAFKEPSDFYGILKVNPEVDEVKYLMVLGSKKHNYTKLDHMFRFYTENLMQKFPVSGGFASTFAFRDDSRESESAQTDTILLAFIGDTSVHAAQIVIPYEDDYNQRLLLVNRRLEELKKNIHIEDNQRAFAFQFTCCSRGRAYYRKLDSFEAKEFRKVFPGVALTGMFSYGELGLDFPSNENKRSLEWLGYSTVFTILSF